MLKSTSISSDMLIYPKIYEDMFWYFTFQYWRYSREHVFKLMEKTDFEKSITKKVQNVTGRER